MTFDDGNTEIMDENKNLSSWLHIPTTSDNTPLGDETKSEILIILSANRVDIFVPEKFPSYAYRVIIILS